MIDHTSIAVKDFDASAAFYDQTLSILGYERLMIFENEEYRVAGYGKNPKPSFWISVETNPKFPEESVGKARGVHIAFLANSQEAVDAWYEKCLSLGGTCNGKPGPRPIYHAGYYGAFIIDPNGWRIEACFHSFQAT